MIVLAIVQAWDPNDHLRGFIVNWMERLAERVDLLVILALEVRAPSTRNNIKVYSLGKEDVQGLPRWRARIRYLRQWHAKLRQIKREHDPQIIFTHMAPVFSVLAFPYSLTSRIPIFTWFSHPKVNWIARLAFQVSHKVITASPEVLAAAGSKGIITGNGVDLNIFSAAKVARRSHFGITPNLITVGRVTPIKDLDTLLDGLSVLKNRGFAFEFKVIGGTIPKDKEYLEKLNAKVQKLGLFAQVKFLGEIPHKEITLQLANADLFVNLQSTGGYGKAVLEAMACGVPTVICTPAFNAEFGTWADKLVFTPKDPRDLAQKIKWVLELEGLARQALRQKMLEVARAHSLERLFDSLYQLFKAAIPAPSESHNLASRESAPGK